MTFSPCYYYSIISCLNVFCLIYCNQSKEIINTIYPFSGIINNKIYYIDRQKDTGKDYVVTSYELNSKAKDSIDLSYNKIFNIDSDMSINGIYKTSDGFIVKYHNDKKVEIVKLDDTGKLIHNIVINDCVYNDIVISNDLKDISIFYIKNGNVFYSKLNDYTDTYIGELIQENANKISYTGRGNILIETTNKIMIYNIYDKSYTDFNISLDKFGLVGWDYGVRYVYNDEYLFYRDNYQLENTNTFEESNYNMNNENYKIKRYNYKTKIIDDIYEISNSIQNKDNKITNTNILYIAIKDEKLILKNMIYEVNNDFNKTNVNYQTKIIDVNKTLQE